MAHDLLPENPLAARAAGYHAGREGKPCDVPGARHAPIPGLCAGCPDGDGQVTDAAGMAWRAGWQDGARDGARLAGWLARMSEVATAHDVAAPPAPPPWAADPMTAGAWQEGWDEAGRRVERLYPDAPVVVPYPWKPLPAARQAPTMWAHPMERYKQRHQLDNADLADRLHGTLDDVLALALCQLPDSPESRVGDNAVYWRDLAARTTLSEPTLRAFLAEMASAEN